MSRISLQMRFFRSKEALLVLIWTAFPFAIFANPYLVAIPYILLSMLWFPIAGCLSDMCVRRYTVIHYSLWLVWFFVMVSNVLLILHQYVWTSNIINNLEIVASVLTLFGMASIWTNTFQFGIDQLTDASSEDITSYISWYVWIFFSAPSVTSLLQNCSCGEYNKVTSFFLLPLLGTVAVVTDCLFNKSLVKEPPAQNTFKLIYQVLKYAAKNKYPRLRSAFTYWEDKPFSRIDLGKSKYGGPFTTEEVEDVKTFFRLLVLIAVSAPYFGIVYILYTSFRDFRGFYKMDIVKHCSDNPVIECLSCCFHHGFVKYSTLILMIFIIPLFEIFLYPLLIQFRFITKLKIKHKLVLGTLLLLVYEVCVIAFEVASVSLNSHQLNSTCPMYEDQIEYIKLDYKWLIFCQPVLGSTIYILLSSYLEMLCAQSPYFMKGLVVGIFNSTSILSITITAGVTHMLRSPINNFGRNCLLWLHTAVLCLTAILMCIQFISIKCYKLRKRDDTLRNDQMFAVDYFNKYLPSASPHRREKENYKQ